jgi:HAD superfamily hydrolase (TIGR01484 family)
MIQRFTEVGLENYRLLVADIDGTLVTSDRQITPRLHAAVRAAQAQGVPVCLATGRSWASAEPCFRKLGADPPAILHNGGLIYDFTGGQILRASR